MQHPIAGQGDRCQRAQRRLERFAALSGPAERSGHQPVSYRHRRRLAERLHPLRVLRCEATGGSRAETRFGPVAEYHQPNHAGAGAHGTAFDDPGADVALPIAQERVGGVSRAAFAGRDDEGKAQ